MQSQAPSTSSHLLGVFASTGVSRISSGDKITSFGLPSLYSLKLVLEPQRYNRIFIYSIDFNRLEFEAESSHYTSLGSGAGMWYKSEGFSVDYRAHIWTLGFSAMNAINFTKPKKHFQMSLHLGPGFDVPIYFQTTKDQYSEGSYSSWSTFNYETNQLEHFNTRTETVSKASDHYSLRRLPGFKFLAHIQVKYRVAQCVWLGFNSGVFRYITPIMSDIDGFNIQSGLQTGVSIHFLLDSED
ncbi:MAG: hypothetical protein ACKVOK_00185 [Flavobacteriales bacterium]